MKASLSFVFELHGVQYIVTAIYLDLLLYVITLLLSTLYLKLKDCA